MGNCPRGEMEYFAMNHSLAGYEDCKTIQILYHIQSGIQGDEHPHPGKRYSTRGFPRIGYLPDNEKGRKVSMAFSIKFVSLVSACIHQSHFFCCCFFCNSPSHELLQYLENFLEI